MSWIDGEASVNGSAEKRQLKSFGLIVGGIFSLLGFGPLLFRGGDVRTWALALSGALVISALLFPRVLRHFYRGWMALGNVLGWINNRVILSVLFYGLFTPIGRIMRWLGRDPMNRKFQPEMKSYNTKLVPRDRTHMKRQY